MKMTLRMNNCSMFILKVILLSFQISYTNTENQSSFINTMYRELTGQCSEGAEGWQPWVWVPRSRCPVQTAGSSQVTDHGVIMQGAHSVVFHHSLQCSIVAVTCITAGTTLWDGPVITRMTVRKVLTMMMVLTWQSPSPPSPGSPACPPPPSPPPLAPALASMPMW